MLKIDKEGGGGRCSSRIAIYMDQLLLKNCHYQNLIGCLERKGMKTHQELKVYKRLNR